ncbi:aldo/keto reductase [Actinomadura sp. DC4]|uniref:aldo/keto reductase n=1 Tax=Actinomadura sp. DC4 TaxID=3055069 RepID=UPI0025B146E3|nr:aldo/keto reductase [Actinomadura sp. DC4]MDN3351514.1 aldo/keto reductase [Actinomadura sp. DC4]
MRYTAFGRRTGLRVSEYALGTGNFGTGWGTGTEQDEARRVFDGFAEAGGVFIDTADGYQAGESETMLRDFLAADRDHFVLASKYSNGPVKGDVSRSGNSRKNMIASVEASLRRLGTDHIDLYWAHYPDEITPMEEIARAFDDLVRSGKILHWGLSNFPAWRVSRAATLAELRGWAPPAGIQLEYSLVERTADRELLPMAESLGLGAALWSPLGGGLLTGKYRESDAGRLSEWNRLVHTETTTQKTAVVDAVLAIAAEIGAAPAQVAVAWMRERAARIATTFVTIIGPRSVRQLDDYLGALDVSLTGEQYDRLTQVSAVPLGMPHDLIAAQQDTALGGDASRVIRPATPVS